MRKDCVDVTSACMPCLRHNVGKRGFHLHRPILAKNPFDHASMDLLQLPTSPRGFNFGFILVDMCTRFTLLRALQDKSALTVARTFWELICIFGPPKVLQSDNGREFVNQVLAALAKLAGIDHRFTVPYNPRANAAAERHVSTTKFALKKMAQGNISDWDLFLPAVQLAINTKVNAITLSSPASLMFGRQLNGFEDFSSADVALASEQALQDRARLMTSVVYPALAEAVSSRQGITANRVDRKRSKAAAFAVHSSVMLRDPIRSSKFEPYYVGPYTVLRRTRANTYVLLDSQGHLLARNVPADQLKLIAPSTLTEQKTTSSDFHTVESILAHRGPEGQRQYLVRWQGFSKDNDSWEPFSSFQDEDIIRRYWHRISTAPPALVTQVSEGIPSSQVDGAAAFAVDAPQVLHSSHPVSSRPGSRHSDAAPPSGPPTFRSSTTRSRVSQPPARFR